MNSQHTGRRGGHGWKKSLRARRRRRGDRLVKLYPETSLWSEIAYLAYHLHWSLGDLLDLEHPDRARLIELVADMNQRAWDALTDV